MCVYVKLKADIPARDHYERMTSRPNKESAVAYIQEKKSLWVDL